MAAAGGAPNGWTPQNQQAFMNETQRIGSQPNLSAQDVVAMAHSGVPDQQIAMAIQQRGSALRTTPGMSQYLAQNGVNPAVLGDEFAGDGPTGIQPTRHESAGRVSGSRWDAASRHERSAVGTWPAMPIRPGRNMAPLPATGVTSAVYPGTSATAGQLQPATYDSSSATPAFDQSAAATGGTNGDTWRAMPH